MKEKFRNSAYPVLGLLSITLAVTIPVSDPELIVDSFPSGNSFGFICLALGLAAFGWRGGIRPVVVANSAGLLVKNPGRTYRSPWSEVKGFRGDDRLVVELRQGGEIRCWAVQRANAARMLDRRSFVDDVVDDLEEIRTHYATVDPKDE